MFTSPSGESFFLFQPHSCQPARLGLPGRSDVEHDDLPGPAGRRPVLGSGGSFSPPEASHLFQVLMELVMDFMLFFDRFWLDDSPFHSHGSGVHHQLVDDFMVFRQWWRHFHVTSSELLQELPNGVPLILPHPLLSSPLSNGLPCHGVTFMVCFRQPNSILPVRPIEVSI